MIPRLISPARSSRRPATPAIVPAQRSHFGLPRAIREPKEQPPMRFTPRQLEVLALLCEGLPNKLISRQLDIAEATVKAHVSCVLRELGTASRLQAVVAARRLGLVAESGAARSTQPALPAVARPGSGAVDPSVMLQILWEEMSKRRASPLGSASDAET